jgi:hypothetical protein
VGQKEIFAVLDTDKFGPKLSSYGVMIPRKSLSMVVGVGPPRELDEQDVAVVTVVVLDTVPDVDPGSIVGSTAKVPTAATTSSTTST